MLNRPSLLPLLAVECAAFSKTLLARFWQHLVSRVQAVIRALKSAWSDLVLAQWNVEQDTRGRPLSLCRVAFAEHGLVGIDFKSHQTGPPVPNTFIVQGHGSQDTQCGEACNLPCPADVWWPSGSPAFQISFQRRAVSNPTRAFFRRLLRAEAVATCPR